MQCLNELTLKLKLFGLNPANWKISKRKNVVETKGQQLVFFENKEEISFLLMGVVSENEIRSLTVLVDDDFQLI